MKITNTYISWVICCILASLLLVLQGILLYNSYDILLEHFSHGMALLVSSSFLVFLFFVFFSLLLLYAFYRQRSLDKLKKDFFKQVSLLLQEPFQKAYDTNNLKTTFTELRRGNNLVQAMTALSQHQEGLLEIKLSRFNVVEELELLKDKFLSESSIPLTIRITDRLESPLVEADKEHLLRCVSLIIDLVLIYSSESAYIQIITDMKKDVFSLSIVGDGIKIHKEKKKYYIEKKYKNMLEVYDPGIKLSYIEVVIKKQKGWTELTNHFGLNDEFTIFIPLSHCRNNPQ